MNADAGRIESDVLFLNWFGVLICAFLSIAGSERLGRGLRGSRMREASEGIAKVRPRKEIGVPKLLESGIVSVLSAECPQSPRAEYEGQGAEEDERCAND